MQNPSAFKRAHVLFQGPLSIDEGAKSSIFAALLPPNTDIKGKYIWEDCTVKDWETFA